VAEFQAPNPSMSLATENILGESTSIAPVNFYNPLPVKDYMTGLVNPEPDANSTTSVANSIFDARIKEINKNYGLENPLINPRHKSLEDTKRYQDPEIGYVDSPNIEFMYGEKQGFTGAIGNSLIQSAGNFVSSFLGSFTNEYAIGSAIAAQDVNKLFDNNLVNAANSFSELGQEWGTIYDTRAMQDNPLFSRKLLTSTISSLGYLGAFAGAATKDGLISLAGSPIAGGALAGIQLVQAFKKMGDLVKIMSAGEGGVAKLGQALQTTGRIGQAVGQAVKTVPYREGFRKFNQYTQGMFEASIEAKEAVTSVEEKLKGEFFLRNGYNATGEDLTAIKDKANEAGNWTYFANAALLTTTNHFEFGELFERWRVGKRAFDAKQGALDLGTDGFNKVINNTARRADLPKGAPWLDQAKEYTIRAAKNTPSAFTMSTGEFIEEMGQGVISGATEDYYANFINPPSNGIQSILRATEKQFTTQEGWLSGISGILTGAAMSGILSAAGVNPMDKTPSNTYGDAVAQELTNASISPFLKEKIRQDQIKKTGAMTREEKLKSDYEKQSDDHLNSLEYWLTGLKHKQYDLRVDQLNQAKDLQGKDFTDEWGLEYNEENKATVNEFIDGQLERGKHIQKIFNHVDKTFINPFDRKTRLGRSSDNSQSYALYDAVKDELVFQMSKFDNNSDYIGNLTNQARQTLKILANDNDLLDLASLYGEEIEDGYEEKGGNIFKRYTIKNKKENSNRGLARIKKDLAKEIKDINSTLASEALVGEDRVDYALKLAQKQRFSDQIDQLMIDGLTETFSDPDGTTGVRHTEDYLQMLGEYLVNQRRESGIKETLTGDDFSSFYRSIRSVNDATLSNERTAKIVNDLLSPDGIKKFKAEGDKIKALQEKHLTEQVLKVQEEAKTKAAPKSETVEQAKTADANETGEESPEDEGEVEAAETTEKEPEVGEEFTGTIFTKDENGEEVELEGTFEVTDINEDEGVVTVKQDDVETTIPIEDLKESDVVRVDPTNEVAPQPKVTSKKPKEANIELSDDQLDDNQEIVDILYEVAVEPDEIAEVDTKENTITVENEKGEPEVFNTLTKALDQKYSDDINDVYKNVAIQTSIVLHGLFNNSDAVYGDFENIPDISEERFNEINAGFKVYNQWLIDNNKTVVTNDFYIKDYNVNNVEGNNVLVHIDLLIYDKKNSLYQVVDFKTRSEFSATKRVNGVLGNNPDQWDKDQLEYKTNLLKRTLSNKDIRTKSFANSNYLMRFRTRYDKDKILISIKGDAEPEGFFGKGFAEQVRDAKELKIEGHTLSSLRELGAKEFTDLLKKNKIPYKFMLGKNGVKEQHDRYRANALEEVPEFLKGSDNKEYWAWVTDNFEIFDLKLDNSSVDMTKVDKKIDDFLLKLNKDVMATGDDTIVNATFVTDSGVSVGIAASFNLATEEIEYTNPDFRLFDGTAEQIREVLERKETSAGRTDSKKHYVPKEELFVRTQFTTKHKIFVNGRKFNDERSVQQIIDDYGNNNLRDIVKGIAEKSNYVTEKQLAANIADKIPVRFSIEFIDSMPKDNRVTSFYDPATERLVINVSALKAQGYSTDNAILHETIHVLTAQRLKTSTKFIADMSNMMREVIAFTRTSEGRNVMSNLYGTTNADIYGLSDVNEFVAEALTSPDMQNLLRTIKVDVPKEDRKQSLWSKFIDLIRKTFGIDVKDFEDSMLAKAVYTLGKEFDTLDVKSVGRSLNLDGMFGKTILKIESNDEYADTNAFGNKVIRENSLQDILEKAVVVKENGVKENFKPFEGFPNIFVSRYPYNLVLKFPTEDGGMEPFTSLGLVAGYRFKRTKESTVSGPINYPTITVEQVDYDNFVDNNKVPSFILESIATKVVKRTSLTNFEQAILAGKTAEINEIIAKPMPVMKGGTNTGNNLLTLDQLANNDISDEEFEEITRVDRSLRAEFISKLNNYINFQTELSQITTDTPLKDTNITLNINHGTLQLVPYKNRTNVNELKPMMFRGIDGVSPAPIILERQYLWQLGGGKTRPMDAGFSAVYNDPIFESDLSPVLDFLRSDDGIRNVNANLKSTYVLVIPKGGVQTEKRANFALNDFDFVPVYPDQYDINDNTYLNALKFLSSYITNDLPVDQYEQALAMERELKNVYVAAPEGYQFQNLDSTMTANAAEIAITDGNGNSKVKGYLTYQFKSSTGSDDIRVSIDANRLAGISTMEELIDALNEELEVKVKGTLQDIGVAFKLTPENFKVTLPTSDETGRDRFIEAITEGKLTTPLHKNVRNVSLNITPSTTIKQQAQPKVEQVIFAEPVVEAQEQAQEIREQIKKEVTQEDIDLAKARTVRSATNRRRPYGFPGINENAIDDLINICG
jgi:hypothetical protein